MMRAADRIEIGQRFTRWTVISLFSINRKGDALWLCLCDCGISRPVRGYYLLRGTSKSCSCLQKEIVAQFQTTHGASSWPEYNSWRAMKERCLNPNNRAFGRYGGRGIAVCKRWIASFADFLADMGRKPTASHSIDRINNEGNYEPGNCRWATPSEQTLNSRRAKSYVAQNISAS